MHLVPEAQSNLGDTFQGLGSLEFVEASSRLAIVLKADSPKAHRNLGNTLQALGRLDGAEPSVR